MSSEEETPERRGGGVLAGLLAPLRLPERAIEALDSLAEAARELTPMRKELTRVREQTEPLGDLIPALERIIEQTKPLAEVLPALDSLKLELGEQLESLEKVAVALEGEDSHLNTTARRLVDELRAMHKTLDSLQNDVQSVTDRLPDASKGPIEKARDVLTGGD